MIDKYLDDRILLLHPPKTAGTSVSNSLGINKYHANAFHWSTDYDPDGWKRKKKIVTIRNPWDRTWSWYWYSRLNDKFTFDEWVLKGMPVDWHYKVSKEKRYEQRLLEQEDWLEIDGECVADYIIHFERIDDDWRLLLEWLDIPFRGLGHRGKNRKKPDMHYTDAWTDEMIEASLPRFDYFAATYGYEFGGLRS